MIPGAILINTAHSSIVNEFDLLEHLEENKNFYYATDVFDQEPDGTSKLTN